MALPRRLQGNKFGSWTDGMWGGHYRTISRESLEYGISDICRGGVSSAMLAANQSSCSAVLVPNFHSRSFIQSQTLQ